MLGSEKLKTVSSVRIEKCGSNSKRIVSHSRQKGSILLGLIITMVVMASLGAGMLYLTTTSTFQELFANNHARAYYSAESGGRYAMVRIRDAYAQATTTARDAILATIPGTYYNGTASSNQGNFVISSLTTSGGTGTPATISFSSIGTVSSGFLQARRQLNYSIQPANQSAGGGSSGTTISEPNMNNFTAGEWGSFSTVTNPGTSTLTTAATETRGSSDEQRAFAFYNNPSVNFSTYQTAQGGFLSYDAQLKVASTAPYFLAGLSFRTHPLPSQPDAPRGFNVSLMRFSDNVNSQGSSIDEIPLELKYQHWNNYGSGGATGPLNVGDYYIILWMDTGSGGIGSATPMEELLAYKRLSNTSGIFATPFLSDGMEYAAYNNTTTWRASGSGNWTQSSTHQEGTYSARGFLTNSGDISYLTYNSPIAISSSTASLTFQHQVSSTSNVTASVELSSDGSTWSQLGANLPLSTSFVPTTITITGTGGNVIGNRWIRFKFQSSTNSDRFLYIDDVKIIPPITWPTLLVRLEEKLLTAADLTTGSSFNVGDRVNKIMVYYSTQTSNGSGNHIVATDDNRTGSNPIGTTNWPATGGVSDPNFTLVQWDWVLDAIENPGSYHTEPSPHSTAAACTSGSGCTATQVWTTYYLSNSYSLAGELGLTAFGSNSAVANRIFFDDFAVKIGSGSGGTDGNGSVVVSP